MKANKIFTTLSVLMLMVVISSCVNDDDYSLPNVSIVEPNIPQDKITTFQAVYARYNQAVNDGDVTAIIPLEEELYIQGYVVSSDQSGNFFEELIIQNKVDDENPASDPRLGIRVSINVSSLYNTYEFGRKVYVKLSGLTIGEENGVLVIGKGEGSRVDQIQAFEYRNIVMRSAEVAEITPKATTLADITEADENTLIQLNDMQFNRNELSLTFAGEPSDEFDGFRTLESCDSGATIPLQTSTFADFKSVQIDQEKGSIQGVYSRDFGDDFNVLIINSRADVNFTNTERCDPNVLECTGASGGGSVIYSENFTSYANIAAVEAAGWTNVNVSGGNLKYVLGSFSGNKYAQISGFSSNESNIESWLVSPAINLDATTEESLTFDLEVAFANGVILSVYVTENFTGDVTTTEWTQVDVNVPNIPSSGFGGFNNVGDINVSCLNGDMHVAFKYTGSDPSATTRYHIDNLEVTGN